MKRSSNCQRDLALEEFPPHKRTRDRRGSWCRDCKRRAQNLRRMGMQVPRRQPRTRQPYGWLQAPY